MGSLCLYQHFSPSILTQTYANGIYMCHVQQKCVQISNLQRLPFVTVISRNGRIRVILDYSCFQFCDRCCTRGFCPSHIQCKQMFIERYPIKFSNKKVCQNYHKNAQSTFPTKLTQIVNMDTIFMCTYYYSEINN